jgi:hypothetical protein
VPDPVALATITADLANRFTDAQIIAALERVRLECRHVAMVDIIERIPGAGLDDGRPSPEEAWSMCPKDENDSCVWTDEMSEAFGAARPLLRDGDHVAARMAFREVYQRVVATARRDGIPVRWSPSLGWDKGDQVRALTEAITKNRITGDVALNVLGPEQRDQVLLALPGGAPKALPGQVTRILPGFSGLLQRMRMEGTVPEGCDPGPQKPERAPLNEAELRERRAMLAQQVASLEKKRSAKLRAEQVAPERMAP